MGLHGGCFFGFSLASCIVKNLGVLFCLICGFWFRLVSLFWCLALLNIFWGISCRELS